MYTHVLMCHSRGLLQFSIPLDCSFPQWRPAAGVSRRQSIAGLLSIYCLIADCWLTALLLFFSSSVHLIQTVELCSCIVLFCLVSLSDFLLLTVFIWLFVYRPASCPSLSFLVTLLFLCSLFCLLCPFSNTFDLDCCFWSLFLRDHWQIHWLSKCCCRPAWTLAR